MPIKTFEKPIDLKNFKKKANGILENRNIFISMLISSAGIFFGSYTGKGEGVIFQKITQTYSELFFENNSTFLSEFLDTLLVPIILFFLQFILGLSIIGILILNVTPFCFGYIIGSISYYIYNSYSLKGLAYCVIVIFPFASITTLSLILNTSTSINMSQMLAKSITRKPINNNFQFKAYCKELAKNFLIMLTGVIIKTVSDYLLSDFFNF